MKNLEEVTYGYYGTTWFCRLCGRAVLKRVRTRERNELHLLTPGGSFCIFIAPLSAKFRGADCQNEAAILAADRIFELLARVRAEGRRVFLYVLDSLHRTGGVERRTELLFDWLLRHGVQPVLLCSQQGYTPLEHIPTISFLPYAPHAEEALIKLIELTGAEVVEFQLKSPKLLHSINLNRLKSQARIGCTVHSRVRVQQEVLDQLDFRATPNQAKELKNFVMIPNVVAFPEVVPQYRVGPRKAWKALYVGRLDKVKLTTIRNFVELCCKHHIKFELAGPLSKQEEVLSYVENLPQGSLIGEIDTRAYLEEHGSEYLFVGGVGQVPLEAAAVNLPAWVSPDVEDYNRGAFLTANNLENLRQWNCTIKPGKIPEELAPGNAEEFFEAVGMASVSGDLCSLEVFRVREALRAQLSEDVVWGQYLRLIEAGAGGKLDEIKSRKSRDRRSVAIE